MIIGKIMENQRKKQDDPARISEKEEEEVEIASSFAMKKNKKEKFLSTIIATQFLFSSFLPFAYAATTEEAPAPAPADLAVLKQLNDGDSDINKLNTDFKNADNTGKINASAKSDESDDIAEVNNKLKEESAQKRKAKEATKEQQINGTSSSNMTAFQAVRSDGSFVTVMKNPCYNSQDNDKCPATAMRYQTVTDSKGESQSVQVPVNSIEYFTSDGKAVDASVIQSIEIQKQQAKITSNSSTTVPAEYASNIVSATSMSMQNLDLPLAQRLLLLAFTYKQAIDDANYENSLKAQEQENSKEEELKKQQEIQERKQAILKQEQVQKDRKVLQAEDSDGTTRFNKTSLFKVTINPAVPVNVDGQDVTLTLTPISTSVAKTGTMQATFKNLDSNQMETVDVTEQFQNGEPFAVELGKWGNRPEGQRTVTITYFPNSGGKKKTYIIRYGVSAYMNSLSNDGKTVSNSVTAAFANADLAMQAGDTLSIAGMISSASWDSSRNICQLVLSDTSGISENMTAIVETSQTNSNDCTNSKGKYAAFSKVLVDEQDNGMLLFRDVGDASSTNVGLSLDQYNENQDASARTTQDRTTGSEDSDGNYQDGYDYEKVIRKDPATGKLVYGLAGSLGYDFTLLPNGQMVSVHTDKDGAMKILKVNGKEYSFSELATISGKCGYNLDKVTLAKDDNGLVIIKDQEGNIINSNTYENSNEKYDLDNKIGSSWKNYLKGATSKVMEKAKEISAGLSGSATV